jgi:uncharacterized DUF497 family protein
VRPRRPPRLGERSSGCSGWLYGKLAINYIVVKIEGMPELRFEWDERKNTANKRKHGVSFDEAQTVFYDDRALLTEDPDEEDEDRFVLLGLSAGLRTLVVCHCYRENDEVIRIISARKAHREERRDYDRRWRT